jgi:cellulose biosynthesis protein BcsQ
MNCSIKGININLSHWSSVQKANPFSNRSSSREEILNKTRKINEGFYILPANLHLPECRVVNPSPDKLINNPQYHKYFGAAEPW